MGMAFLNKLLQKGTTSDEISAQASPTGEALVAQGMAPFEEISRTGSFHCTTTTPVASVVALPTTAASIRMFNTATDGGRSIVIDAIYAVSIVGHGTLGQFGLICVVGQTRVAALVQDLVVRKSNGMGAGADSTAALVAGGALDAVTGVAIGWIPVGPTANMSVISLPSVVLWAPIDGRIIVPPGRQFGVNVMGVNATTTFNCGIMWHEKQLDLS